MVTVIVCTYNRSLQLSVALDSLLRATVPFDGGWEVLVVDNNSTDQTREVADGFCRRNPGHVRYVFEAQQGLSNARNAGIREARGQIVAFTDDDITVHPDWLHKLTDPFRDDRWAGVGGRVRPPQDFVQPAWLVMDGGRMDSSGVLALFDAGNVSCELTRPPFGANMAFRKDVFQKYGGFLPELGRSGDSLIGNEDTEFGSRLMAAGERMCYEPTAIVYHPVSAERMDKRYFLRWWHSYGRAMYRQTRAHPVVLGVPRAYFSLVSRMARWLTTSPWKPQVRFYWKCRLWVAAGELTEIRSQRKRFDSSNVGVVSGN